jgi:hypothetical protein
MTDRWGTTRTGRPCVWFEIDLEGNGGGARAAGRAAIEGVQVDA